MKTNTTTQEIKKSNSLIYRTSKNVGNENISVSIRLNDECKNGHQDFAITGDVYEAGKPKIDRYHLTGGCIHDEILKYFPEFRIFVSLHLCDYKGIPMHPTANGLYHLTKGFNNTPVNSVNFKTKFCEYYRITPKQFDELKTAKNKIQYALKLESLKILAQWEVEANEAIKILENLTNTQFLVDSKRTQYIAPTEEEIKEEEERQKNGYYTPEAENKRNLQDIEAGFTTLENEYKAQVKKYRLEYDVKKQVLKVGGKKALENIIFYNHSKELAFNWNSYDKLAPEIVEDLISKLKLPKGVTVKDAKGK